MDFNLDYFKGVTGASIRIDDNGDSEGNYTVLAVKFSNISRPITVAKMTSGSFSCHYEMVPVGRFDYTNSTTPVILNRFPLDAKGQVLDQKIYNAFFFFRLAEIHLDGQDPVGGFTRAAGRASVWLPERTV